MSALQPDLERNGARRAGAALDVSELPSYAFGHRSLMWWATAGVIAIEGTVFALAIVSYFYLRSQARDWTLQPWPDLLWGSINTAIMLASIVPNEYTKIAAQKHDLRKVRIGMVVCIVMVVFFIAFRFLEFQTLNVRWDTNAYGSIVWLLLGLHTVHLLTDFIDTVVLAVLMFTGPIEGRRYVDVAENAVYWYFVVAAWLPIYAVVYWAVRA